MTTRSYRSTTFVSATLFPAALAALVLGSIAGTARADDLRVPQDFRTVRKATRHAQPGDRILIAPGTYRESVVCKVPGVTYEAEREGVEWISRRANKPSLTARADNVTVRGILFVRGGIRAMGDNILLEDIDIQRPSVRGAVEIVGNAPHVHGLLVESALLHRKAPAVVRLVGDAAELMDVQVGNPQIHRDKPSDAAVLAVQGVNAQIHRNEVFAVGLDTAIRLDGSNSDIRENSISAAQHDGIVVRGAEACLVDNEAQGLAGTAFVVEGDLAQVLLSEVRNTSNGIRVTGDGADVSSNAFVSGLGRGVLVQGEDALIRDNGFIDCFGECVTVEGSGFSIEDNDFFAQPLPEGGQPIADPVLGPGPGTAQPIENAPACPQVVVRSENGGVVTRNDLNYVVGTGIHVEGNQVEVSHNSTNAFAGGGTAIVLTGDGNSISDNSIATTQDVGIQVTGSSNAISGNKLHRTVVGNTRAPREREGVHVQGDRNVLEQNVFHGETWQRAGSGAGSGAAFSVEGNLNLVQDNTAEFLATDGFVLVAGDDNMFCRNVVKSALRDGFCISSGSDNTIEDCVATNCGDQGLDHRAVDTTVTTSTFTSTSGNDVTNTGTFRVFEGNMFGAPGGSQTGCGKAIDPNNPNGTPQFPPTGGNPATGTGGVFNR